MSKFISCTGEDGASSPSGLEFVIPVGFSANGSRGSVGYPITATPHTGTQQLIPEDFQLIVGAVADILCNPSTASPITLSPSHLPNPLAEEGTSDAHEGIYPYEYTRAIMDHGLHEYQA